MRTRRLTRMPYYEYKWLDSNENRLNRRNSSELPIRIASIWLLAVQYYSPKQQNSEIMNDISRTDERIWMRKRYQNFSWVTDNELKLRFEGFETGNPIYPSRNLQVFVFWLKMVHEGFLSHWSRLCGAISTNLNSTMISFWPQKKPEVWILEHGQLKLLNQLVFFQM